MIIRQNDIEKRIMGLHKEYKALEYESRRVKRRGNFVEKELKLKEDLEKPLNILKIGVWWPKIVEGVRTQVWLPSGEEIFSRSVILDWKEDLEHLKN